jgi:hypothetical protein
VSGEKDLALVILADFFSECERAVDWFEPYPPPGTGHRYEEQGSLLFLRRGYDMFSQRLKSYAYHEAFVAFFLIRKYQVRVDSNQIESWLAALPPLDEYGYLPDLAPQVIPNPVEEQNKPPTRLRLPIFVNGVKRLK